MQFVEIECQRVVPVETDKAEKKKEDDDDDDKEKKNVRTIERHPTAYTRQTQRSRQDTHTHTDTHKAKRHHSILIDR